MSLKDKKSLYDLAGGIGDNSQPVSANNDSFPSTLEYYRDGGQIDGPFIAEGGNAISKDHMIDLLTKKVKTNTLPPETKYQGAISPTDLDTEGQDGGNGYWHGIPNPGKYDGKQINGKDLHVHLLENEYTYTHGNTFPNAPIPADIGPGNFDILGIETDSPSPYTNPDTGQVYNIT